MRAAPNLHDPRELLTLADRLWRAGVDLTITRVQLPASTVRNIDRLGGPSTSGWRGEPIASGDAPVGVRLLAVPNDSVFALLGLHAGDLITSLNGYAIPSAGPRATIAASNARGLAVAEIVRGGRHDVLAFEWSAPPARERRVAMAARPSVEPARRAMPSRPPVPTRRVR
jgi:hypothetical protein